MRRVCFLSLALCLYLTGGGGLLADERVKKAEQQVTEINREAARAQGEVDNLHEQTQNMANEYRVVRAEHDSMRDYNNRLVSMIESQEQEIVSLERQLAGIEITKRELSPLMEEMVENLKRFVELDLPFLLEERRARVERLEAMLARGDVTVAEKFRRVLEAYQIENEYGHTFGSYRGEIGEGEDVRSVEFVRVGRLGLYNRTLDGDKMAIFDPEKREWRDLPARFNKSLREAIQVAERRGVPDFVSLPLCAKEGCDDR